MPSGRPGIQDLITLAQASAIAGYANRSALSQAVRRGRLRAIRMGDMWFTTREWLQEYIDHRPANPWYEERRTRGDLRQRGDAEAEKGPKA